MTVFVMDEKNLHYRLSIKKKTNKKFLKVTDEERKYQNPIDTPVTICHTAAILLSRDCKRHYRRVRTYLRFVYFYHILSS